MRGDAVRELAVAGRIDAVDARAHHGDGAAALRARVQRASCAAASMPRASPLTTRQPCDARWRAKARAFSWPPGVARAHHGQRRALQEGRLARDHQQDGRIGNGQQALRIAGIGQRQDVVVRRLGPFQAAFHLRLHVRRHGRGQLARQRLGQVARQRRGPLRVDLLGQAQRAEQRAGGGRADVRLQGQAQPGGQFGGGLGQGHGQGGCGLRARMGPECRMARRGPPAGVDRIAHRPCAENGPQPKRTLR